MENTVNQEFKDLISAVKFAYKLKQSEVASKIGVTGPYLSDMINGRVPETESIREKIYELFSDVKKTNAESVIKENKKEVPFEELPLNKQMGKIYSLITNIQKDVKEIKDSRADKKIERLENELDLLLEDDSVEVNKKHRDTKS